MPWVQCGTVRLIYFQAVLLWIHGGGFNLGSANSIAFNGAFLADKEDVVVVSIQYRMNIFGFPGANCLSAAKKLGILTE
jgi:carboxylesterase type B